jgi:hypothetical protein
VRILRFAPRAQRRKQKRNGWLRYSRCFRSWPGRERSGRAARRPATRPAATATRAGARRTEPWCSAATPLGSSRALVLSRHSVGVISSPGAQPPLHWGHFPRDRRAGRVPNPQHDVARGSPASRACATTPAARSETACPTRAAVAPTTTTRLERRQVRLQLDRHLRKPRRSRRLERPLVLRRQRGTPGALRLLGGGVELRRERLRVLAAPGRPPTAAVSAPAPRSPGPLKAEKGASCETTNHGGCASQARCCCPCCCLSWGRRSASWRLGTAKRRPRDRRTPPPRGRPAPGSTPGLAPMRRG